MLNENGRSRVAIRPQITGRQARCPGVAGTERRHRAWSVRAISGGRGCQGGHGDDSHHGSYQEPEDQAGKKGKQVRQVYPCSHPTRVGTDPPFVPAYDGCGTEGSAAPRLSQRSPGVARRIWMLSNRMKPPAAAARTLDTSFIASLSPTERAPVDSPSLLIRVRAPIAAFGGSAWSTTLPPRRGHRRGDRVNRRSAAPSSQ